jgi:uncharacterized membrane protein YsdA (DUF1294 family)
LDQTIKLAILAVYILINIVALLMYVWDKHKAKNDMWRTPEASLIAIAFFGPFGATAGMLMVRHKTRKPKFKLVYVFLVLHIIAIAYLAYAGYLF